MISNRQSFGRSGRRHSPSSTLRASRILATRRPQFLIRYQQLEFNVNSSKQTPTAISNPQNRRFIFSKKRPESGPRHPRFSIFKFPFSASPRPFWWLTAHPHFRQTSPPKDLGAPASRCPANSSRPPLHRRMIHCEEPQHD